jgi:hypothetical protein
MTPERLAELDAAPGATGMNDLIAKLAELGTVRCPQMRG